MVFLADFPFDAITVQHFNLFVHFCWVLTLPFFHTGPSFQALGILRLLTTTSAFFLGYDCLHKASIRGINAFVYVRMVILLSGFMMQKNLLPRFPNSAHLKLVIPT